jgi:hypothetical protein
LNRPTLHFLDLHDLALQGCLKSKCGRAYRQEQEDNKYKLLYLFHLSANGNYEGDQNIFQSPEKNTSRSGDRGSTCSLTKKASLQMGIMEGLAFKNMVAQRDGNCARLSHRTIPSYEA